MAGETEGAKLSEDFLFFWVTLFVLVRLLMFAWSEGTGGREEGTGGREGGTEGG